MCEVDEGAAQLSKDIKGYVWQYISDKFSKTPKNKELNLYFGASTMLDRRYIYDSGVPEIAEWPSTEKVKDYICKTAVDLITDKSATPSKSVQPCKLTLIWFVITANNCNNNLTNQYLL